VGSIFVQKPGWAKKKIGIKISPKIFRTFVQNLGAKLFLRAFEFFELLNKHIFVP